MASSNSSQMQNSGSEGDLQHVVMDERKRKRMESNRESARRSRARKQKHLDELTSQIAQLRRENQQVLQTINVTTQQFLTVDAENSVLRAQMNELTQRLESLNEMVNYMNTLGGPARFEAEGLGILGNDMGDLRIFNEYDGNITHNLVYVNEPWNLGSYGYLNQPIMASADVLQY